jgi:GGDEF domain-containing protein
MKKKFIVGYGITAFIVLIAAVGWFVFSVSEESRNGALEAERSFSWLSRETAATSVSDGFMSDSFIQKTTDLCRKSHLLSALVISTPSGAVFSWPEQSPSIQFDINGKPQINGSSPFMKVYSANLDVGDGKTGSIVITAVLYVLEPGSIFAASRSSFLVILALLFVTLIVIFADTPMRQKDTKATSPKAAPKATPETNDSESIDDTAISIPDIQYDEIETVAENEVPLAAPEIEVPAAEVAVAETVPEPAAAFVPETSVSESAEERPLHNPEGLFSPVTGTGWEQYLKERLDAELVRAASSEQDLALIIIRVSGLLHTDLLARKIAQVLLDTFRFKDMVFEYGNNGFAGILQNVNLDQAMKTADALYAGIDGILMDMNYDGQITIGITTRTARLLPASRMIEEADSAAKKAIEEPSLPIVAFRANPEKYRDFIAENS